MAWRYCGNQLKLWRTRAGVTREELGREAGYTYEAVKSMEQGRRKPTLRVLEVADQMCAAQGLLIAAQDYLKPDRFPSYSQDYMRYEADAIALSWYESQLIPGLLQTPVYARALMNGHCPPLDDETIEERVAARLERQSMLEKQTKGFNFVIEETALRRRITGADAHVQQMRYLVSIGEQRNVTLQVMSTDQGYHPGLMGPFVVLETPEHDHLAYEEGQSMGALYADPEKVSVIRRRHDMILRRALSPEESVRFIGNLAEGT
ncbi:Scr1 family TA system antitoxin-like transcriptional regulator [Streptomyces sp. NPDC048639]|uniref:helix-turn-helix domain-containing protein n=1 Tax=Streptomyces sp. NPDC048639 TaxID=3365581 RepID=UPI0037102638